MLKSPWVIISTQGLVLNPHSAILSQHSGRLALVSLGASWCSTNSSQIVTRFINGTGHQTRIRGVTYKKEITSTYCLVFMSGSSVSSLISSPPLRYGSRKQVCYMCAQIRECSSRIAVYIDDLWRCLEETAPPDGEKETYTDSKNLSRNIRGLV